jgi:dihydrofolate reductase
MFSIDKVMNTISFEDEVFVIGGAMVYKQFMPLASKLYITHVDSAFDADTWFPVISPKEWKLSEKSEQFKDEASGLSYCFAEYQRVGK